MHLRTALFLILLLCVPVLARALPPTQAVRAVLDAQVAAWNRGDLVGYMGGYWRSPLLTFFSGGTVTHGWDETLARYQKRYLPHPGQGPAASGMGTLDFADVQIELLASDVALARGGWRLRFAAGRPDGKTESKGLFTVLLRCLPEGWRVVHDHSSIDTP